MQTGALPLIPIPWPDRNAQPNSQNTVISLAKTGHFCEHFLEWCLARTQNSQHLEAWIILHSYCKSQEWIRPEKDSAMSMVGFILSVEMVCGSGARPLVSFALLDKPLTLPVTQLPYLWNGANNRTWPYSENEGSQHLPAFLEFIWHMTSTQ